MWVDWNYVVSVEWYKCSSYVLIDIVKVLKYMMEWYFGLYFGDGVVVCVNVMSVN